MNSFEYTVKDENGIHARPAGLMARKAAEFACDVTIECNGKSASLKKLLSLMGMGIKKGDTVRVFASDSTDISSLKRFMEENI